LEVLPSRVELSRRNPKIYIYICGYIYLYYHLKWILIGGGKGYMRRYLVLTSVES
jgi:hypothetical protein